MGGGGMAVPLCMQEEIQRGNWKRIWGEELGRGRGEEGEVLKGRWWWCWEEGREGKVCEVMQLAAAVCRCRCGQFLWPALHCFVCSPGPFWWLAQAFWFTTSLIDPSCTCACLVSDLHLPLQSACRSGTQTQLPQKPFCIWCSKAGHFLLSSLQFCTLIHQAEWKSTYGTSSSYIASSTCKQC